jgi:hypothetical protein
MWRKGGGRRTFQVEELRNDRVFCVGMSMGMHFVIGNSITVVR